jgi:hypothetical protein
MFIYLLLIPVAPSGARFVSLQFLNIRQSVGLLGRGSARCKASTYTGQKKHNRRRQTSMPQVGFEPMTEVLEGAKTFHVVHRAALVIGVRL